MIHIKRFNPNTHEITLFNTETSEEVSFVVDKDLTLEEKHALIKAQEQKMIDKVGPKPALPVKQNLFKRILAKLWPQ